MTSMLFAGDSYMLQWTIYDYIYVLSIAFLLIVLPLWIIVALITKGKYNNIFMTLIHVNLAIFVIFSMVHSANNLKKNYKQEYKSQHNFQKSSIAHRQHYGNDVLVPGTEKLTILDMHTHINSIIQKKDVAIYFLTKDNRIYRSYFNRTEPVIKIMELNNTRKFLFDSFSPDDIVVYDNNGNASYYRLSYKNYKYTFDKNETERVNRDEILSSKCQHDLRPKIIKGQHELQFKKATPFKVKYEPKLALKIDSTGYRGDMNDSLYVVYKNKKGLYRLRNIDATENEHIQEKVGFIIKKAIVPKENVPDVSSLKINQETFDKLRIFLMEKPAIDYDYKLFVNNNHATVVVTSKEREDLKLIFKLLKEKDWDVVDVYTFVTQEQKILGTIPTVNMVEDLNQSTLKFYENEFEKHAKRFIEADNIYDIFSERVKYGVALQCLAKNVKIYDKDAYFFRANNMEKYANSLAIKNIKFLYDFESIYNFETVSTIENKLITDRRWICEEGKSSEQIYQLFIDDYIKLFIDSFNKKTSKYIKEIEWYTILKNKHYELVTYFEKEKS